MNYPDDFENFWQYFAAEEHQPQKGAKRAAFKSWEKVKKEYCKQENVEETEFARHVWRGYQAVVANRQAARRAKSFVPQLKHASTWLNQWCFEEEQQTTTREYKDRAEARNHECDCGTTENIIGRSYNGGWICRECDLDEWKERNREAGIALVGKHPREDGESWRDWSFRVLGTMPIGVALKKRYGIKTPHSQLKQSKVDALNALGEMAGATKR